VFRGFKGHECGEGGECVKDFSRPLKLSSLQKEVGAEMPDHEFTTGRAEKGELAIGAL
jgi:hypothetical protein